jgi:small subunit ribosomal protein S16
MAHHGRPVETHPRLATDRNLLQETGKKRMAVKLRLMRMGKKKQPTYRVVAADSRAPRNGRFIEIIGTYDPRGQSTPAGGESTFVRIDDEKALKWLRNGAQPTDTVERLLKVAGTWDAFKAGKTPAAAES